MSPSAHPSQWSTRRTRLLALPFVALCAVVYLGSALHFVLVRHSMCLEHGEVIDIDEVQAGTQPRSVEVSFSDERVTRATPNVAVSHDAEAHCSHAFLRREGLIPTPSLLLAPEAMVEFGSAPRREQMHPEPVARLRLAPKASPPLP